MIEKDSVFSDLLSLDKRGTVVVIQRPISSVLLRERKNFLVSSVMLNVRSYVMTH